MLKKLRKVNNISTDYLHITIPKFMIDILDLKPNQIVDVEIKGKKIIINTEITKE